VLDSPPQQTAGDLTSSGQVRAWEYASGMLIGVLFLLPLLMYGPFEEEELPAGIFASQWHYKELLHGHWLSWLPTLGFGTPLPIGLRMDFHPVFALSAVSSLRTTLSAVWLVHMFVMVAYFLRLAALTAIRPPLRLVLLACYVFSSAAVCNWWLNDWVTVVVGWTLYPMVVFYVYRLVNGGAETNFWRSSVALGLVTGLWMLNSHDGYNAHLLLPLAIYTAVVTPPRARLYLCLFVSVLLCMALCSERFYFYATEMRLFPPGMLRNNGMGYTLMSYVEAAAAPLIPFSGEMRLPFIGLVLGIAALASLLWAWRPSGVHVRACGIAFLAAVLLGMAPSRPEWLWRPFSAMFYFRDPMVFWGILAGGWLLQRGLDSSRRFLRVLTSVLIALQAVQQSAAMRIGVS
jgi:hypothetical protein